VGVFDSQGVAQERRQAAEKPQGSGQIVVCNGRQISKQSGVPG
jgi:hypothetical protein